MVGMFGNLLSYAQVEFCTLVPSSAGLFHSNSFIILYTSLLTHLIALVIECCPLDLKILVTMLLIIPIFAGAFPNLIFESSSFSTTSFTQCKLFSIAQCALIPSPNSFAFNFKSLI